MNHGNLLIPFGLYECPECKHRFVYGPSEQVSVICPECKHDLTENIMSIQEAARRGFEGIQHVSKNNS